MNTRLSFSAIFLVLIFIVIIDDGDGSYGMMKAAAARVLGHGEIASTKIGRGTDEVSLESWCTSKECSFNPMIDILFKGALPFLGQILEPDVVINTFNSLIRVASTELGRCSTSKECSFNSMIDMLFNGARPFLEQIMERGLKPEDVINTLNSLLRGVCLSSGQFEEAAMLVSRIFPDIVNINNMLLDAVCKQGLLMERLSETMMKGFCLQGEMDKAKGIFNLMVTNGFTPRLATYQMLVNGYPEEKRKDEALRLIEEMSQKGMVMPDTVKHDILKELKNGDACMLEQFGKVKKSLKP